MIILKDHYVHRFLQRIVWLPENKITINYIRQYKNNNQLITYTKDLINNIKKNKQIKKQKTSESCFKAYISDIAVTYQKDNWNYIILTIGKRCNY